LENIGLVKGALLLPEASLSDSKPFDFDLSEYVFSNGFYIFQVDESWNKKFVSVIIINFFFRDWIIQIKSCELSGIKIRIEMFLN